VALFLLAVHETSTNSPNQQSAGQKPRLRFAKSARLLKHSDFERVYRQGRRFSLPDMAVFYLLRSESTSEAGIGTSVAMPQQVESGIRVGFTVPRALGGAVQRNRIKRRMREAVRLSWSLVRNCNAADVVINPRRSVAEIEFERLVEQVRQALQAIQLGRGSARSSRSDAGRKTGAQSRSKEKK
jgi:ribonuclease P protein component